MARRATTTPGTAVANWEEELAQQAQAAAAMEAGSGNGQFFSVKSGQLALNGEAFPNNEMAVVVLDSVIEHVFYPNKYDPDTPEPPACFGFGRDADDAVVPDPAVVAHGTAVSAACRDCPKGAFGTSENGRGRACRWTRRLALIPAGGFVSKRFEPEADPAVIEKAEVAYLKLPVTSVKFYSGMVKQTAAVLKRPPYALFTRIWVTPNAKTQFQINFETLGQAPDALIPVLMQRSRAQRELTAFPYNLDAGSAAAAAAPAKRPAGKRRF